MNQAALLTETTLAEPKELDRVRFDRVVAEHVDLVFRTVRRLGVSEADADDATQRVLLVLAERLVDVAIGKERSFLFGTCLRVAVAVRRERRYSYASPDDHPEHADPRPLADAALAQRQARALLDRVLETLPMDHRVVFVMHELEELPMAEIATLLEIAPGTVASRLRRARELFQSQARKLQAASKARGTP